MAKLSTELAHETERLQKVLPIVRVAETYDPTHFGDASLTMSGSRASVRFIRDRGQIFLDIAGPSGRWRDAQGLLQTAGLASPSTEALEISEQVNRICSNFDKIVEIL